MTNEDFQKKVLFKLSNLEKGQLNLEKGQLNLEKSQGSLEKSQGSLESKMDNLGDKFDSFKEETSENFEHTNSMINQAFEKISDNLSYQDTVNEMEKVLTSRNFISKQRAYNNYVTK